MRSKDQFLNALQSVEREPCGLSEERRCPYFEDCRDNFKACSVFAQYVSRSESRKNKPTRDDRCRAIYRNIYSPYDRDDPINGAEVFK